MELTLKVEDQGATESGANVRGALQIMSWPKRQIFRALRGDVVKIQALNLSL